MRQMDSAGPAIMPLWLALPPAPDFIGYDIVTGIEVSPHYFDVIAVVEVRG